MTATAEAPAKKNQQPAKVKPLTKTQLKAKLAEKTGLTGKQVAEVLDALTETVFAEVKRAGSFTIPGVAKVVRQTKKATPEKQGINPLTKQPMTVKAKPERNVVKVRPLKALKDSVV